MIQIYKPTQKNTGAAISFQASDRDRHLYVQMIKQHSWNAETKKGSFIENRNQPGKNTTLKFNQVEAGGMLDAIEKNYEFKAFHNSPKSTTQISLGPATPRNEGEEAPALFVFRVSQTDAQDTTQKSSFFIPITYGELRLIQEYLIHYLHKSFRNLPKPAARPAEAATDQTPPPQQEDAAEPLMVENTPEGAVVQGNPDW